MTTYCLLYDSSVDHKKPFWVSRISDDSPNSKGTNSGWLSYKKVLNVTEFPMDNVRSVEEILFENDVTLLATSDKPSFDIANDFPEYLL